MRRTTAIVLLAAGVLLGACASNDVEVGSGTTATTASTDTLPPPGPDTTASGDGEVPAELVEARQRWEAADVGTYQMVYEVVCFCPRTTVTVDVTGGEVTDVSVAGEGLVPDEPQTVEAMFDELEQAYRAEVADVQVTYDPELGYPADWWIDVDERMADEEYGAVVQELSTVGALPPQPAG